MHQMDVVILNSIKKKAAENGISSLHDAELISMCIKSGDSVKDVFTLSQNLLKRYNSLGEIYATPYIQLTRENKGLTESKAMDLKVALELGRRANKNSSGLAQITSPQDIYSVLQNDMAHLRQENFKAVLLNTKNMIIGIEDISLGTINASLVHAREVFRAAIVKNAYSIVLVHNHPSSDPAPSESDRKITEYLTKVGELLGIKVLDHIIICAGSYYSFSENQTTSSII